MSNSKYIAFFGSIGVGKTTTGKELSKRYENIIFLEENVSENPFIELFYNDMESYGFQSSIAMLNVMADYYDRVDESKEIIILDQGIDELICYTNLELEMGVLSDKEYYTYLKLYNRLRRLLPQTSLYVYFYCKPDVALERIKMRGRKEEENIKIDFLINLNKKYKEWIEQIPIDKVLCIDTTNDIGIEEVFYKINQKLKNS